MNDAQRYAQRALVMVNDLLRAEGLLAPGARMSSTIYVADYSTEPDLQFFKPGWAIGDYEDALTEFERLSKREAWALNRQNTMTRAGYETFNDPAIFSRLGFVLKMLGWEKEAPEGEGAHGLLPLVIISQPQSPRSPKGEQRLAITS